MTRRSADSPAGESAELPPSVPRHIVAEGSRHDVVLSRRQRRRAARKQKRQAKDAAYELRQQRKKNKDPSSWRGHHIVDTQALAQAFPEPETPEFFTSTVRRRILHGATLVVLLAMVVAALVFVGMIQRGELKLEGGAAKPPPVTCPAETLDYPANKSVTVNVFNGGSTEGRAGQVAAELKKRGFVVQEIANKASEFSAAVVIISGSQGHGAALNVQRNFAIAEGDSEYVQDDREDASVDVILTSQFKDVVPAPKVDHTPGMLSCPRLSPPPSAVPSAVPSPAVTAVKKP